VKRQPQLWAVLLLSVQNVSAFDCNPSSGTDKNTGRKKAYKRHIIIKGIEISTSPYLQTFLLI
jgi:hypothetical protein